MKSTAFSSPFVQVTYKIKTKISDESKTFKCLFNFLFVFKILIISKFTLKISILNDDSKTFYVK